KRAAKIRESVGRLASSHRSAFHYNPCGVDKVGTRPDPALRGSELGVAAGAHNRDGNVFSQDRKHDGVLRVSTLDRQQGTDNHIGWVYPSQPARSCGARYTLRAGDPLWSLLI